MLKRRRVSKQEMWARHGRLILWEIDIVVIEIMVHVTVTSDGLSNLIRVNKIMAKV